MCVLFHRLFINLAHKDVYFGPYAMLPLSALPVLQEIISQWLERGVDNMIIEQVMEKFFQDSDSGNENFTLRTFVKS